RAGTREMYRTRSTSALTSSACWRAWKSSRLAFRPSRHVSRLSSAMSCRADDNPHDEVERQQASYRELFDHAERLRVENERLRTALLKIEELTSCPGLKD